MWLILFFLGCLKNIIFQLTLLVFSKNKIFEKKTTKCQCHKNCTKINFCALNLLNDFPKPRNLISSKIVFGSITKLVFSKNLFVQKDSF